MDEIILDDVVGSETDGVSDTESVVSDTELGENALEPDTDSVSIGSGSDGSEGLVSFDAEKGGYPVYIVQDTEQPETLMDDELGGVPVVLVNDLSAGSYAGGSMVSYQLPAYYVDYFSGVLANLGDTDYVSFCIRDYTGSGAYGYVEHYYLVYDLDVDSGTFISGSYPCIDIYRSSGSSSDYSVDYGTYSLTDIPSFAYGSFGKYSDFREGGTHSEFWALLFFLGFFAVYSVCHDIFDYVMSLRRG